MNEHFIKIDANGAQLPADATDHVAVLDTRTNLMWSAADVSEKRLNYGDAMQACSALTLVGFNDWRAPTVEELFLLADRTKYSPAIDVDAFPTCASNWYWSSTPDASVSGYAWVVFFYGGGADFNRRGDEARVRAVRSVAAPASQ